MRASFRNLGDKELRQLSFYRQFIRRGDTVFDVGANRGQRTKIFLELGAKVIAFEPQPICAEYLKSVLNTEQRFSLVQKALGSREGEAEMRISSSSVLSSLSPTWIEATKASGRFAAYEWDKSEIVSVTTLDRMIEIHGIPSFMKIDVEGFELEVVRGLSHLVPCLSMEFTAEYMENSFLALDHLASLGRIEGQFSHGESMEFALEDWCAINELKVALGNAGRRAVGDIYVRSNAFLSVSASTSAG